MTIFGYVSKNYSIKISSQITQLMEVGCDEIFIEMGDFSSDEELHLLLQSLSTRDTVVVTNLLIFGKNLSDLTVVINEFVLKNVRFISLEEQIDTDVMPSFFKLLSLLDRINKQVTGYKVKQRLGEVKESGKQLGRPSIDYETIEKIKYLRKNHHLKLREIAEKCGVSVGTVYKYVD